MSAPTTVEEYLRQIPNPAPCAHSATTSDPPCHDCIERRITTANALRAGQDPSAALGLVPPAMANGAAVATPPQTVAPDAATEALLGVPLDLEVNPDDFDDEGFPLPGTNKLTLEEPTHVTLPSEGSFDDKMDAAVAQLVANQPPVPEGAFMTPGEPNPLVPGMTTTPPQPIQAPDPAALLAQMTGGAIEQPAPPAAPPVPTLDAEQLARRAEIEAGTHPAVAEVLEIAALIQAAPDNVPRSTLLGYAQKSYEVNELIVWPGPPSTGLPIGEPLNNGDALMVDPATGLVVKYVDPSQADILAPIVVGTAEAPAAAQIEPVVEQAPSTAPSVEDATTGSSPEERPPLHPAGHRDALIKFVKARWPELNPTKDDISYIVIDMLTELAQLNGWGEVQNPATPTPQTPATQPQAPVQPAEPHPAVVDAIAEAAAVAAPVQVDMSTLTQHCPHGMPGTDFATNPPRSASCVECMNDGGPPPTMSKLVAERFQLAHLETQCARAMCNRTIQPGTVIGLVSNVGWCCAVCTKPVRPAAPTA